MGRNNQDIIEKDSTMHQAAALLCPSEKEFIQEEVKDQTLFHLLDPGWARQANTHLHSLGIPGFIKFLQYLSQGTSPVQ